MIPTVNQNLAGHAAQMPRTADFDGNTDTVFFKLKPLPHHRRKFDRTDRNIAPVNRLAVNANRFTHALQVPKIAHFDFYAFIFALPNFLKSFHSSISNPNK